MRFVVLTAVNFKIMVSQDMILCNVTDWYQYFAGAYCLHLRDRKETYEHEEEPGSSEVLRIVIQNIFQDKLPASNYMQIRYILGDEHSFV
jgi:hypothetical protein